MNHRCVVDYRWKGTRAYRSLCANGQQRVFLLRQYLRKMGKPEIECGGEDGIPHTRETWLSESMLEGGILQKRYW